MIFMQKNRSAMGGKNRSKKCVKIVTKFYPKSTQKSKKSWQKSGSIFAFFSPFIDWPTQNTSNFTPLLRAFFC